MSKSRTQKGITLIALIITIIVLLILAVVAIGAVTNDGIINYAKNARGEYEKAGDNEKTTLGEYLSKIEENLPGNAGTGTGTSTPGAGNNTEVEEEENLESESGIERGVKVTGSNATFTQKINGKTYTAQIPVGFCVVKDIKGDSNTITRGLVISDVADDDLSNSKKGNQFVWIPVEDYSKFHLIDGYRAGKLQSVLKSSKEAGDSNTEGSPMINNVVGTVESIAMYKSVKENKGFYIARFEAGKPNTIIKTDGTVKPLSQKGITVWNDISWGGTEEDTSSDGLVGNDNADGAVKVARSMYIKSNECGVTSTLCYGVQWDAVMNYIDPNYYEGECAEDSFVRDSSRKGNYSASLKSTGIYGIYEQNHIFDLAGNVGEWTMEAYDTSTRVSRGGIR